MTSETNWIPGVVVLLAALSVGAGLALRTRGGRRVAALTDDHGDDLERKRDGLYQQIRELDAGRSAMETADWRQERHRLEIEAARVLRALDRAASATSAPVPPRSPGWVERHPRLVNSLWGIGGGVFVAGLLSSVQEFQKPKPEMGGAQEAPSSNASLEQALAVAKAAAAAAPEDNAAQLQYAKMLLQADQTMEAFQIARKVTDRDPENPTARTYQAVVLIQIGDFEMAAKALDKVLSTNPDHVEALGYRGLVYLQKEDRAGAVKVWEHLLEVAPEEEQEFAPLIAMAKDPNARNPFAQTDGPAAGALGPDSAGPMAGGPMAGGGTHVDAPEDVHARIELDPALGPVPPGLVVLVYARPAGATGGPPALARKFSSEQLPLDFRIGPSDSPMGGAMPADLWLSARIDGDGNPMTHSPDDAEARLDSVKPGQTGLVLTLTNAASAANAPAGAPPPASPSGAAAFTGAVAVAGTISADPAAGPVAPGQVLFVYVRAAGATGGPPVLAKRLSTDHLPLSFSLGPSDSPMGGAVPALLSLTVRIDTDGNPATHGPGDLEAKLDGVKAGTTGIQLQLKAP